MTKITIHCDHCGKAPALQIPVYIERYMGPAGSMEDDWGSADLCHECAAAELKILMDGKDNVAGHHRHGKQWLDKMKKVKSCQ